MDILEIAKTKIRGENAITFPLQIHSGWISDSKGHHILDVRGWGFIQYLGEGAGEFQDAIGAWVVKTLNEDYERKSRGDK